MQVHEDTSPFNVASGFLDSAGKFPEGPALFINGRSYSFREILDLSSRIVTKIRESRSTYVGVFCSDDVNTYAAILGVALSGKAWCPLNPRLGKSRLQDIIRLSGMSEVICSVDQTILPDAIDLIDIGQIGSTTEPSNIKPDVQPVAYLLSTSGSTGEPRLVPVKKESLKKFLLYIKQTFDFNEKDGFLQPFELSWDVSVFCMFAAWQAGACVYPVAGNKPKPVEIAELISLQKLSVINMVPSALQYLSRFFFEFDFPYLRHCFFSGEALPSALVGDWRRCSPNSRLYNCYGPTETTIFASIFQIPDNFDYTQSQIPIGKMLPGLEYTLVDPETGEQRSTEGLLCLAGQQVMDGYLNSMPDDGFVQVDGKRYYNTGDLVKLAADGNFVFCGRKDTQVKVDGYRVELQEIEQFIRSRFACDAIVRMAMVKGRMRPVAFVTCDDTKKIAETVGKHLPAYMLPERFYFIEKFPLTLTGKTDIQKLLRTHEQGS